MKHIFLFTSLLFILFLSCEKNKNEVRSSIIGDWELRSTYGGLLGGGEYQPGNGNILTFTKTNYESYSSGQLMSSGEYTKERGVSPATGREMDALILNKSLKIYYEIKKDTMTTYLGVIAADGVINKYVRQ